MSTRVSTSPMIARPTVSLTPWARRYGGSSTVLIVFANEHAAEDHAYLRRCTWALFQQGALPAACLLVGAVAVGLVARCLAQKRYNFCVGVPSSAV
jgi:hypothetical protein